MHGLPHNWRKALRPEAELLLYCARPQVEVESGARVRELLQQDLDWAYLHRIASRNGQMPALALHLAQVSPGRVPADSAACLQALAESHHRQNVALHELLYGLLAGLEKAGVAALPYVEAHACFAISGRMRSRPCQWLDVVIRPEQAAAAQQVVTSLGPWTQHPWSLGAGGEPADSMVFDNGPRGCAVSLHWATARWRLGIPLELQEVWSRKSVATLHGRGFPVLSAEDALLHTCVQHLIGQWVTLAGVTDVAHLLRAHPDLQWGALLERARRAGMLRALLLGLHLAAELLETELPPQVEKEIRKDSAVPALAGEIVAGLFHSAPAWRKTPQELKFHLRACERAHDKARTLWRYATTPTQADLQWVRLPGRLAALYRWLRPVRLAAATLRLLRNRPLRDGAESVSGYSPSAERVVDEMLKLAEVRAGDVIYDLGCGDGRIVIEAARRFGVRGVGIDLDAQRVSHSQENAGRAGVQDLVTFHQQDVMKVELSEATVVTMYLPPDATLQMMKRLEKELAPGSRVVSHNAAFDCWDKVQVCETGDFPSLLYLRRVKP